MRQFLKGRDILQSIMEVKVLYPQLRKYENLFQIQSEVKTSILKNKNSVHVDFEKIIQGKLGLFKAVPITYIAISSFSILVHEKKVTKVTFIVCSFHLVKFALPNCVLLLFRSIFLCYLASISYVQMNQDLRQIKIKLISK